MSLPQKRVKPNEDLANDKSVKVDFNKMYDKLVESSRNFDQHEFGAVLKVYKSKKHPILQVVQPQNEVYKSNPEKKKKPIEAYLDTVNHLYKKGDLDILINPVAPVFVYERWAPRQVAIFEEAILKFGKQFEFIAQLISTKNPKDVYEFYLEWKSTSHYKSYKSFVASNNRSSLEDLI